MLRALETESTARNSMTAPLSPTTFSPELSQEFGLQS
jgi:hypothetical protein